MTTHGEVGMWWGNLALVEVVHWACVPRGGHRRVEYLLW